MGGAAALLSDRRVAAAGLLGLGALVGLYTAFGDALPGLTLWWDVLVLATLVLPAAFALVWLALPWREAEGLLPVGLALVVLALVLRAAGLETLFDLAKLAALVALGFWFLTIFESAAWVVLVAFVIPWVDAVSVWRGPTEYVVEEQPGFFEELAYAFRVPGEDGFAYLGPPDVLFFALFLAAAARFGLRVGWTWIGMVAGLGITLALAVWADVAGLPALPGICLGFLVPNADRLWRLLRAREPAAEPEGREAA